jgi:polo-like kinase 1
VPITAQDTAPNFDRLPSVQWRRNFEAACYKSKIGVQGQISTEAASKYRPDLGPSIMQQDKDFRYAVQPDSPVGALIQCV